MKPIDTAIHLIGIGLLAVLGLCWWWLKNPRLKQLALNGMTLVLGIVLVDALLHVLPNSIARFIYGSHPHYTR
ncbi:MAG: hypothetical protein QX197_06605 [Methylococcaceae bacterium]